MDGRTSRSEHFIAEIGPSAACGTDRRKTPIDGCGPRDYVLP